VSIQRSSDPAGTYPDAGLILYGGSL